jgi:Acyl carrier protein
MREVTIEKVLDILNTNIENTEITTVQSDEDLSQLGMDSIMFIRIIVSLEEEFECEIPDSKLLITEMNTVNKIFKLLKSIENGSVE